MKYSCELNTENNENRFFDFFKKRYKLISIMFLGGVLGLIYSIIFTSGDAFNPISNTILGILLGFVVVKRPCSIC